MMLRALVWVVLLGPWCALAASPPEDAPTRVLFVGDSITVGVEVGGNFPLLFELPWVEVENIGVYGTTTTDLNPRVQRGDYPETPPRYGGYWGMVEQALLANFPPIVHVMLGVNDAEGVNQTCSPAEAHGPPCPVPAAEYRANLEAVVEEIRRQYESRKQRVPLILISSPTVSPRSGIGALGPANRKRLAEYEDQVYRLVERYDHVCFGINGREVLDSPTDYIYLDWHPTIAGHGLLADALEKRFEAMRLSNWASTPFDRWEAYLNGVWMKATTPDWYSFEVWLGERSVTPELRAEWAEKKKAWHAANESRGFELWTRLCHGASVF